MSAQDELLETLAFHPEAIQELDLQQITPALLVAACKSDGRALAYVPARIRSIEACLAAIAATPLALAYVPDDLLGQESLRQAVRARGSDFESLWPHLTSLSPALRALHSELEDETFWAGIGLRT